MQFFAIQDLVVIYDLYACVATSACAMLHAFADTAVVCMLIVCMGIFLRVSPLIRRECKRIVYFDSVL